MNWSDTAIKLILGGTIMVGGLLAAFAITIIGIYQDREIAEIVALGAIFTAPLTTGMGYFFGHSNGYRNGKRNGGSP